MFPQNNACLTPPVSWVVWCGRGQMAPQGGGLAPHGCHVRWASGTLISSRPDGTDLWACFQLGLGAHSPGGLGSMLGPERLEQGLLGWGGGAAGQGCQTEGWLFQGSSPANFPAAGVAWRRPSTARCDPEEHQGWACSVPTHLCPHSVQ